MLIALESSGLTLSIKSIGVITISAISYDWMI